MTLQISLSSKLQNNGFIRLTYLYLSAGFRKMQDFTKDENGKNVNKALAQVRHDFYQEKRSQKLCLVGEKIEEYKYRLKLQ